MKLRLLYLLLGAFCLQACSNQIDDCITNPVVYPNRVEINGSAYQNSLIACREGKLQTYKFVGAQEFTIKAAQGTVIQIFPDSFSQNGVIIQDTLTLTLLEMYTPGALIACQLSTNGLNSGQSVEPLLSEGIGYIEIRHNGQPVELVGEFFLFMPSQNNNLSLSVFRAPNCQDLHCDVLWENTGHPVSPYQLIDAAGNPTVSGYRALLTTLGWFSFARFNPDPAPRGILYNKAPSGYTATNSKVFLTYDSPSIGVGLFSAYDSINMVFSEKYGEIPNQSAGHVIFVSKDANAYRYEAVPVVTEDGKITFTQQLQTGDAEELIQYINHL